MSGSTMSSGKLPLSGVREVEPELLGRCVALLLNPCRFVG